MKKKQYYIKTKKAEIPIEIEEKYLQDYIDDDLPIYFKIVNGAIPFFPIKKIYGFETRGSVHRWDFHVEISKKEKAYFESIGIDMYQVLNIIPEWWVNAGLSVKIWCFFQDLLNFNNPFVH